MIPYDKKLHFICGAMISVFFSALLSPLHGLIAAVVAGLLKELRDSCGFGDCDAMDAIATVCGGVVGAVISYFVF